MITTAAPTIRILPAGDRGLLVAPDDQADLAAVVRQLRHSPVAGIEDILPAAQTLFVTTTSSAARAEVEQQLKKLFASVDRHAVEAEDDNEEPVTVVVRYDGADLEDVAAQLGISVADVVAAHTARTWRCVFTGFAPGFGYLESGEGGLTVPRRREARTAVPAGSVALADGYSAIYPRRSPGGWQIIGTTDAELWNLDRPHPALLRPGTKVRFVDEATS